MEIYKSKYTGEQIDELLDQISQGGGNEPLVESVEFDRPLPDQDNVDLGKIYKKVLCIEDNNTVENNLLYVPHLNDNKFGYAGLGDWKFKIEYGALFPTEPTLSPVDLTNNNGATELFTFYTDNNIDFVSSNPKIILSDNSGEEVILNLTYMHRNTTTGVITHITFGSTVSRCSSVDHHFQITINGAMNQVSFEMFNVNNSEY